MTIWRPAASVLAGTALVLTTLSACSGGETSNSDGGDGGGVDAGVTSSESAATFPAVNPGATAESEIHTEDQWQRALEALPMPAPPGDWENVDQNYPFTTFEGDDYLALSVGYRGYSSSICSDFATWVTDWEFVPTAEGTLSFESTEGGASTGADQAGSFADLCEQAADSSLWPSDASADETTEAQLTYEGAGPETSLGATSAEVVLYLYPGADDYRMFFVTRAATA